MAVWYQAMYTGERGQTGMAETRVMSYNVRGGVAYLLHSGPAGQGLHRWSHLHRHRHTQALHRILYL